MHHVGADGVSPAHVSPDIAFRVVLVEQVILALIEDHAVGVVHEVVRRREVILWPPWLVVTVLCECADCQQAENNHCDDEPQHTANRTSSA